MREEELKLKPNGFPESHPLLVFASFDDWMGSWILLILWFGALTLQIFQEKMRFHKNCLAGILHTSKASKRTINVPFTSPLCDARNSVIFISELNFFNHLNVFSTESRMHWSFSCQFLKVIIATISCRKGLLQCNAMMDSEERLKKCQMALTVQTSWC